MKKISDSYINRHRSTSGLFEGGDSRLSQEVGQWMKAKLRECPES
ncbi:MAG: hypothetical protein AAF716_20270 [Cyanobacteria bacterium P01_D01_bin.1]